MEATVLHQQAKPNTVYHCLYSYYYNGYSKADLAKMFTKCEKTISNWINVYEATGAYGRVNSAREKKFTEEQKQWLLAFFRAKPLSYLDEAQEAFVRAHRLNISKTSVWRIIHNYGLTRKVLEQRAMHVREADIFRFVEELSHIDWSHHNVVFLDEVSFDNRGMIRKKGYAFKGEKLTIRGDFRRKPRVSVLAFIGISGFIDFYDTEGSFDRLTFAQCCDDFANSQAGRVRQYPGSNSVWILDGASIHRDPEIVHYLRSLGIVPIFLPAYCPFYNPIEFLFGYVKRAFQRYYKDSCGGDLLPFIVKILGRFKDYDMARVYDHCGWKSNGVFDHTTPSTSRAKSTTVTEGLEDGDENFGFHVRA